MILLWKGKQWALRETWEVIHQNKHTAGAFTCQSFSLPSMNFKPLSTSAFISYTWATEWTDHASSGVRARPCTRVYSKKRQYSWRKLDAALCYTRAKWQLSNNIIPKSKYTIFFSFNSFSSDCCVTATAYALGILRHMSQAAGGLGSCLLLAFDSKLPKWRNHKDQPRPADCDDDNSLSSRL